MMCIINSKTILKSHDLYFINNSSCHAICKNLKEYTPLAIRTVISDFFFLFLISESAHYSICIKALAY